MLGSDEHGAETAGRLGEPRIHIVGELFVIGVDRIISQNRDIDPERIVIDNTMSQCGAKTRPRRSARGVTFLFEIGFEELPAQLERNLEPLNSDGYILAFLREKPKDYCAPTG